MRTKRQIDWCGILFKALMLLYSGFGSRLFIKLTKKVYGLYNPELSELQVLGIVALLALVGFMAVAFVTFFITTVLLTIYDGYLELKKIKKADLETALYELSMAAFTYGGTILFSWLTYKSYMFFKTCSTELSKIGAGCLVGLTGLFAVAFILTAVFLTVALVYVWIQSLRKKTTTDDDDENLDLN